MYSVKRIPVRYAIKLNLLHFKERSILEILWRKYGLLKGNYV